MVILVLNFGGQYAHLLPRRVRELGAYSEILSCDAPLEQILVHKPSGIILSGGPASVYEEGAPKCDPAVFAQGIPVLGICYGHQLMAQELGGAVVGGEKKQFGRQQLTVQDNNALFKGLKRKESVWFSHGDSVTKMPSGFKAIASSRTCKIAGMADEARKLYGVQFHPEVVHTPHGMRVLENFVFGVCGAEKSWTIGDLGEKFVADLKKTVGGEKVIVGVSGGVDSLVVATLLNRAIGENLYAMFIDHGLLRKDEAHQVLAALKNHGFKNIVFVDASTDFLNALKGVADPEEKRRIIGHTFIRVFEREARRLEQEVGVRFLAQGTIYPDRIESAQPGNRASKIKSHHNVTLPEKLEFQIIEPLKDLYKDEVRKLGESLGLTKELLWRHPFPGPGLAIRVLGEVTEERLGILREADAVFLEELKKSGWYDRVWQAFAAIIPVRTVGVKGDARTYEYIITLRAVQSVDGMTADWVRFPPRLLEKIANRITNEVRGANRVLYDVSQKPPSTIEYL